jgi:hypothetical protein
LRTMQARLHALLAKPLLAVSMDQVTLAEVAETPGSPLVAIK